MKIVYQEFTKKLDTTDLESRLGLTGHPPSNHDGRQGGNDAPRKPLQDTAQMRFPCCLFCHFIFRPRLWGLEQSALGGRILGQRQIRDKTITNQLKRRILELHLALPLA